MPPGGKRRQGVGKMLVRGGRNDNRIDIPAIKQGPVIRKAPWPCPGVFPPPGDLKRALEPGRVYIAERGNPGIGRGEGGVQELSTPVTKSDEAQADLGLRAGRIRRPSRTKPHRSSRNTGGMNEKLPA